jgi:hypothetical protein
MYVKYTPKGLILSIDFSKKALRRKKASLLPIIPADPQNYLITLRGIRQGCFFSRA